MADDNTISTKKGSLIIVGSGIQAIRQFTLESRQAIEQALGHFHVTLGQIQVLLDLHLRVSRYCLSPTEQYYYKKYIICALLIDNLMDFLNHKSQ